MRYLIDGHNLIPKIKNLSLQDVDDEEKLISLLNRFSTKARAQVEVYFDNAPADSARSVKIGAIKVHFIKSGSSADAALIDRMRRMGTFQKGISIVSSDHVIQNEARRMKFKVIPAGEFALKMENELSRSRKNITKDPGLNTGEIEEWLKLFDKGK